LTPTSFRQARVRLVMSFTPAKRPWPLFSASPWQMDVAFPVGDKSFTLAPGRSSRAYEGSPVVPGKIVGLGGHMHEYGRVIEFADVTTGEVIYRAAPVADSSGHIASIPIAMLYGWTRLGVHIVPAHRYRIAVSYDNPTGAPIPDGGMRAVAALESPLSRRLSRGWRRARLRRLRFLLQGLGRSARATARHWGARVPGRDRSGGSAGRRAPPGPRGRRRSRAPAARRSAGDRGTQPSDSGAACPTLPPRGRVQFHGQFATLFGG